MSIANQQVKIHQTALQTEDKFLLVSNISIPEEHLLSLDSILDRVQTFIVQDYINTPNVHFQVCATYDLRHSVTGQIKTWTGSFNPRGNQLNALNGYQRFDHTFKTVVKEACSDDNIYRKLRLFHVDTRWVFDQLVSIYITVQAVVPIHHPTISKRGLASPRRNGKTQRATAVFYMP